MKKSHKVNDAIRQNENIVKVKHSKYDANLQKNSTIYFQVGLILVLLAVYGAFEWQFQYQVLPETTKDYALNSEDQLVIPVVKLYEETVNRSPEKKVTKTILTPETNIDKTSNPLSKETLEAVFTTAPESTNVLGESDPVIEVIEEPEEDYNILSVQHVPVFSGCEYATNNSERIACMSSKIAKHISRNFNSDLAEEVGLHGIQKIYVKFKINTEGQVEVLNTRASHPRLEKEAKRVVEKIPNMIPGKVNNKSVNVIYMVPIKFKVD